MFAKINVFQILPDTAKRLIDTNLYSPRNDPDPEMIPNPEMIPKSTPK